MGRILTDIDGRRPKTARISGWENDIGLALNKEQRWERDRALVKRCLAGDAKAWEDLISRYRRLIFSIPTAMNLDGGRSEEIFQEVCVRLYQNLAKLKKVEGLASWLTITARREALRTIHGSKRWVELEDDGAVERMVADEPQWTDRLEQIEAEHALQLALEQLDDRCAELLKALYLEDPKPSYQVLSQRLGRPVGSLGPTSVRCLKKLRDLYAKSGGEVPWRESE